jgi:predicted AlkP superfamily pyrophosphatase or phosphodiesterase
MCGMPRAIVISLDGLAAFYWHDPEVRMPRLRALAERGVVADGMETVFPSTTWPTHVSLVTGVSPVRHGVVGNSILNRVTRRREDLTGDPVYDAADIVRAPTLHGALAEAGRVTAAVDWPATRNDRSLRFNLPFFKDQQVFERHTARAVWDELRERGFPVHRQGEWAQLPKRFLKDHMVARVAVHVAHRYAPDLMLVHFLCTDSHQHLYGPRSPEAYWAIEYVDGLVGALLDALPAGALDHDTAVFVVSDHGFMPVQHEVRINVALRRLGVLRLGADGSFEGDACFVMNHGAGYVYGMGGDRERTLTALADALRGIEGVEAVWTPSRYAAFGLPTPEANPLTGDLLLEARPGYYFVDEARGEDVVAPPHYLGTHGYHPRHPDNHAFFLAAGAGIARGGTLPTITSRQVAPTIARVLGIAMPGVEGQALEEALR